MVEAAPAPSFKMSQPDLLLEFLISAFRSAIAAWQSTSLRNATSSGSVDNQYLIGSFSPSGHSINSHSFGRLSASQ